MRTIPAAFREKLIYIYFLISKDTEVQKIKWHVLPV